MEASDMGLWIAVIGACGVIVGALINTTLSVVNSAAQRRLDSKLAVRQEKLDQYFAALNALYRYREALLTFKESNSGLGIEDGKRKSRLPWKNREYKFFDQESAGAVDTLFDASKEVALQRARIDLVGTTAAADAFEHCYSIVSSYLDEVGQEVMLDGRFIYATWEQYWDNFNNQLGTTLTVFREDVRI